MALIGILAHAAQAAPWEPPLGSSQDRIAGRALIYFYDIPAGTALYAVDGNGRETPIAKQPGFPPYIFTYPVEPWGDYWTVFHLHLPGGATRSRRVYYRAGDTRHVRYEDFVDPVTPRAR
jgi:hypothetical protein